MRGFPELKELSFVRTREQIHGIARLIGKIREILANPEAKNDNLWLEITDSGFSTPPILEYGGLKASLNLASLQLEIISSSKKISVDVRNKTAFQLSREVLSVLKEQGIEKKIDFETTVSDNRIQMIPEDASDFLLQFTNYAGLLEKFRMSIDSGEKTRICLWPHHFDNAFVWFSGRKIGSDNEQVGIGVTNGDELFPLPYAYMTYWPLIESKNRLEVPSGAVLNEDGWTGFALPYQAVAELKSPAKQEKLISSFFSVSFNSIQKEFSRR